MLAPWVEDARWSNEGFGLNGIAARDSDVYAVTYAEGRLFRIDGQKQVHEVELPRKLNLPDGLKALPDGDLLVVEGSGALSRITLSGDHASVTMLRDGLNQPTTAAPMTGGAWVLEGQLMLLADPARKNEAPRLPFGAVWVPLP
jgi:hypothetical protein